MKFTEPYSENVQNQTVCILRICRMKLQIFTEYTKVHKFEYISEYESQNK
jgi:hypothetical protein